MKVALSGLGGDELFGGYDTFSRVPDMVNKVRGVPGASMFGKAFRVVTAPWISNFVSPKAAGILEHGGSYGGAYLLRRGLYMPWELGQVMDGDMARAGLRELDPILRLNHLSDGVDAQSAFTGFRLGWYGPFAGNSRALGGPYVI